MSGYSILVVDDEEAMRSLCGRVLRAMGHAPLFAATLEEALGKLRALDRLDLLVTDLRLPDGGGVEAAKAARARFPEAGLLVITAYLAGAEEELAAIGVNEGDILAKPFELAKLEAAVSAKLAGRKGT